MLGNANYAQWVLSRLFVKQKSCPVVILLTPFKHGDVQSGKSTHCQEEMCFISPLLLSAWHDRTIASQSHFHPLLSSAFWEWADLDQGHSHWLWSREKLPHVQRPSCHDCSLRRFTRPPPLRTWVTHCWLVGKAGMISARLLGMQWPVKGRWKENIGETKYLFCFTSSNRENI